MNINFLTLCLILVFNHVFGEIKKKHIDIDHVAELILKRSIDEKNFVVDVFQETVLKQCDFKCENDVAPIANPDNVPNYNGCGSYNFNINFEQFNMGDFDKCCNVHDVCYEICNEPKKNCDSSFGTCLNSACDRWAVEQNWGFFQKLSCKTVVKTMETAVGTLGCTAYKSSQEKACTCSLPKLF